MLINQFFKILIQENPLSQLVNSRRDSSGALQSPDVLDSPKEDGFYLLKKDSQRRETLVKVSFNVKPFFTLLKSLLMLFLNRK